MRRGFKLAAGAALAGLAAAFAFRRRPGCDLIMHGLFTRPVDEYAPLELVSSCDPEPKPGVEAFRDWVIAALGGSSLGISRDCGIGSASKHHEGRAWDWRPPDVATGTKLVQCLTAFDEDGEPEAVARRAGLRTIIWQRHMWVSDGAGWRPYGKAGRSPHEDHVHFGFSWAGANGQTSLYELLESGRLEPTNDVELVLEEGNTVEVRELLNTPGLEVNTTLAFKRKAIRLADAMSLDPGLWLAVMSFETGGSFSPSIRNPASGATGLIQFTKKYAPIVVGKTVEQLANMSALEQLDYVDRWYRHNDMFRRIARPRDYYLAVFAPAGIGKPLEHALYTAPSQEYEQNRAMDVDGDGVITVGDVSLKFRGFLQAAAEAPPLAVTMSQPGAALAAALAVAVAAAATAIDA